MKNIEFFALLLIMITITACSADAVPEESAKPPVEAVEMPTQPNTELSEAQIQPIVETPIAETPIEPQPQGNIYLYGELHEREQILNKEFELWYDYYHNENMRHLFYEAPYYSAGFLNLWMKAENDEIFDELFAEVRGTAMGSALTRNFFERIKKECPETIFHGTDIGHQHNTTGQRYLIYLRDNGLFDSEEYALARLAVDQGIHYYSKIDDAYRENKMAENFIREFDKLNGESVMGIYGGAHTWLDAMDIRTQSVGTMGKQLKEHYGDIVYSEDLSYLVRGVEFGRIDIIKVNGKEYEALYFGGIDIRGDEAYTYFETWRLENAYDDFKDMPLTGGVMPYHEYPMTVEIGQVFVVDAKKQDGTLDRVYFRSDGNKRGNRLVTEQFLTEE